MAETERDNYVHPGNRFSKGGHPIGAGQGLSVRDFFAAHALTAVTLYADATEDKQFVAAQAYEMADAMIAQRNNE